MPSARGSLMRVHPPLLVVLTLLALLVSGSAAALAPAHVRVDAASELRVDAHVTAALPGGSLISFADATPEEAVLVNATGVIRVFTTRGANVTLADTWRFGVHRGSEEVTHRVAGATVRLARPGDPLDVIAVADDRGGFTVAGHARGRGHAVFLPRDAGSDPVPVDTSAGWENHRLTVAWREGWAFLGENDPFALPFDGHPRWEAPRVGLAGPVNVQLDAGHLAFTDVNGTGHAYPVGHFTGDDPNPAREAADAREQTRRWALFEGTVEAARVPAGDAWGVAAPAMTWDVDGRVTWREATGAVTANGTTTPFEGARVTGDGVVRVTPAPLAGAPGAPGPAAYDADGAWRVLEVDGARAVDATGAPVAAAAAVSVLALLATLLFEAPRALALRVLVGLYARVPRDARTLDHPRRQRIMDEVRRQPGVTLRELHRRSGSAWGAFRFHVGVLTEAGYVRVVKEKGYAHVYPAEAAGPPPDAAPAIPSPVARAIYDALPADGAPRPAAHVRAEVGITPQLMSYHVKRLVARGLVIVRNGIGRGRDLARAKPPN